jgi:hypothetical protein
LYKAYNVLYRVQSLYNFENKNTERAGIQPGSRQPAAPWSLATVGW